MADDRRPYSVLTKGDVKAKMKKQIEEITEIFWVSRSDATVLLMYLRWDSVMIAERLVEDKEKLLTESGLKPLVTVVDSNQDSSSSECFFNTCDQFESCGICLNISDEIDNDDDLISTPICSHKFCKTCLRDYLDKSFYSLAKNQTLITCPHQDCRASVGQETIEKLTVRDTEMYERYILRSYLEENVGMNIKQCPSPDCNYAIEFHKYDDEEYKLNVVCLCGFTFCWRCNLESHRPVTCNNASDWLNRDLVEFDKSLSLSWIDANTKPCPSCLFPVEFDDLKFRQILTCACSFRFCWKCLRSEEDHYEEAGSFGSCVAPETEKEKGKAQVMEVCVDRWEACQVSMYEAKKDLKNFDENITKNPNSFAEEEIRIAREGLMLMIQCRQVLKWSCVYDYFHTEYESSKKEYLWFLQEHATTTLHEYLKTLLDETKEVLTTDSVEELCILRQKLVTATSNIGNYFYYFIKALNDGLVDVKTRSYDGFAGPCWFCDRCTYGNSWLHKACKMCCDEKASSKEMSP